MVGLDAKFMVDIPLVLNQLKAKPDLPII